MNTVFRSMTILFFLAMSYGCAIPIRGVSTEPADKSVSVSIESNTEGSLFINKVNGTTLADVTRLLRFKIIYPHTVYMRPGTYQILVRHVGGGYQPIESLLPVTLTSEHNYVIKNSIEDNTMFFWVEEADTGRHVSGWKASDGA